MRVMRGRTRYVFDIAMRGQDHEWSVAVSKAAMFSRRPKETTRSIAERWIFEQAGQLRGSRLLIVGKRARPPRSFDADVRIRIMERIGGRQLAAAYTGVDRGRGSAAPAHPSRDHYLQPATAVAGG